MTRSFRSICVLALLAVTVPASVFAVNPNQVRCNTLLQILSNPRVVTFRNQSEFLVACQALYSGDQSVDCNVLYNENGTDKYKAVVIYDALREAFSRSCAI